MEKHLNRVQLGFLPLIMVIIALAIQIPIYAINDYYQVTGFLYVLLVLIKAIAGVFGVYLVGFSIEKQLAKHKEKIVNQN